MGKRKDTTVIVKRIDVDSLDKALDLLQEMEPTPTHIIITIHVYWEDDEVE